MNLTNSSNNTLSDYIVGHYTVTDLILVVISAALFITYQMFYLFQFCFFPHLTNLGVNISSRKRWIRSLMRQPNIAINGIQGMRNGIMSSSYFASAALIITTFAATTAKSIDSDILGARLIEIQTFILAIVMGLSFLFWLMSIKAFTHISFLFGVQPSKEEIEEGGENFLEDELNFRIHQGESGIFSATVNYFLGIRTFFLAICIGAWIFDPIACITVTCIVVVFMYFSDHSFNEADFVTSRIHERMKRRQVYGTFNNKKDKNDHHHKHKSSTSDVSNQEELKRFI